jgi:pimeloyl-ACP methyl ester carboxylesterase
MRKHSGKADVNGTRLYYEVAGTGEPLVLVHGQGLDTRMWDDQFAVFAEHYRVVRYDMRGYGRSALPTGELYAPGEDLMALMRHLDILQAHVVGLSRGGRVAIDFALTYPQALISLVLVDAALGGFQWTAFGESLREVKVAWRTGGREAACQRWLTDALFAPAWKIPAVAAHLTQMVTDYPGWATWAEGGCIRPLDPPAIERLDRIEVPTLVMVGELDLPDFRAIAQRLADGIPHAQSLVLSEVGHMANMEDPDRFNAVVLDFLAACQEQQANRARRSP